MLTRQQWSHIYIIGFIKLLILSQTALAVPLPRPNDSAKKDKLLGRSLFCKFCITDTAQYFKDWLMEHVYLMASYFFTQRTFPCKGLQILWMLFKYLGKGQVFQSSGLLQVTYRQIFKEFSITKYRLGGRLAAIADSCDNLNTPTQLFQLLIHNPIKLVCLWGWGRAEGTVTARKKGASLRDTHLPQERCFFLIF